MRRGQTALEYMATYGWAIMLLLVVVGALGYFGYLSPSQYLPERCSFGSQMFCGDYAIERVTETKAQISFKLENRFSKDISIEEVTPLEEDFTVSGCAMPVMIPEGEEGTIQCLIDADWPGGDRIGVPLTFTFKNDEDAGAALHNVTGELYAGIPEEFGTTPHIECSDGVDNDLDGCWDFDSANPDGGCTDRDDDDESDGDCNIPDADSPLSCVVTSSCHETVVMKLTGYTDAHAEEYTRSNFEYDVCCASNLGSLDADCSGSPEVTIVRMSNFTNAHVADGSFTYGYRACLSTDSATTAISCQTRTGACAGGESCVVALSGTPDGHAAECSGPFNRRVCCEVV